VVKYVHTHHSCLYFLEVSTPLNASSDSNAASSEEQINEPNELPHPVKRSLESNDSEGSTTSTENASYMHPPQGLALEDMSQLTQHTHKPDNDDTCIELDDFNSIEELSTSTEDASYMPPPKGLALEDISQLTQDTHEPDSDSNASDTCIGLDDSNSIDSSCQGLGSAFSSESIMADSLDNSTDRNFSKYSYNTKATAPLTPQSSVSSISMATALDEVYTICSNQKSSKMAKCPQAYGTLDNNSESSNCSLLASENSEKDKASKESLEISNSRQSSEILDGERYIIETEILVSKVLRVIGRQHDPGWSMCPDDRSSNHMLYNIFTGEKILLDSWKDILNAESMVFSNSSRQIFQRDGGTEETQFFDAIDDVLGSTFDFDSGRDSISTLGGHSFPSLDISSLGGGTILHREDGGGGSKSCNSPLSHEQDIIFS
jgi:hypothetical protein